jgi:glycosyltransferase involved in cell wall biosynthesis
MKRRLQVIHYPIFGGPHNEALRLAAPLAERGWETTVLIPDEPGNALSRLQDGGVDVVTMPLGRVRALKDPAAHVRFLGGFIPQINAIRRLIRERQITLVQIGGLVNPHAAIAARLEGVPVVWQVVDTRTPQVLRRAMVPVVTRLADTVLSTGRLTAAAHPGLEAMGDRLIPFFPPVDCAAFAPRPELRDEVRAEWGIDSSRPVMGAVGNINPMKGIEYLIEATAKIANLPARPRLVLAGSEYDSHTGYSQRLRSLIAALGLSEGDDVLFLGGRSDIERQLQGFDVMVMGSVPMSEGTPTSILEAAACGIPAVATSVGGVSEIIEDGVTGYTVPPLDPAALAAAVERVLGDPARRAAMGAAARKAAVERFDVEVCAETHIQAFAQALAHRTAGKSRQSRVQTEPVLISSDLKASSEGIAEPHHLPRAKKAS